MTRKRGLDHQLAPLITKGNTLYFLWALRRVQERDWRRPPKDVDVILAAPKCSGRTVPRRTLFKEGGAINSSITAFQDVTSNAKEKAIAIGIAVGSGYLYETTFEKELYFDPYGERVVVSSISKHPPL
jgi:ketol-acid reductoisomerase